MIDLKYKLSLENELLSSFCLSMIPIFPDRLFKRTGTIGVLSSLADDFENNDVPVA